MTYEEVIPIIERDIDRIDHGLTVREPRVLEWLYGFHGEVQHTLEEIQRRWSVSAFKIRVIQAKAIDLIRANPPKICTEGLLYRLGDAEVSAIHLGSL